MEPVQETPDQSFLPRSVPEPSGLNSQLSSVMRVEEEPSRMTFQNDFPKMQIINGRPRPIEIPFECVEKMVRAMDTDQDECVSIEELKNFIQKHKVPFEDDLIVDMFAEAVSKRAYVHISQREKPLTAEEIYNCVRGRESKDMTTKQWGISYRPFRDHWILLLKKVNAKVFAHSQVREIPYIDPARDLKAQYQQGIKKHKAKRMKDFKVVLPLREPVIHRQIHTEGNVQPDPEGKVKTLDDESRKVKNTLEPSPYESVINGKIADATSKQQAANGFMKVSFESQEYYNQAVKLTSVDNFWGEDVNNPIYTYLPEKPPETDKLLASLTESKVVKNSEFGNTSTIVPFELSATQNISPPLRGSSSFQAAGGLSIRPQARTFSLTERRGASLPRTKKKKSWISFFKIDDIKTYKAQIAKDNPVNQTYEPPASHQFRVDELPLNKPNFNLRFKCPPAYNPLGISEHDRRPKFTLQKEQVEKQRAEKERDDQYYFLLTGKQRDDRDDWKRYFKLPDIKKEISTQSPPPMLNQEQYEEPLLAMIRNMRDEKIQGKPLFDTNIKPVLPIDKNKGFGGVEEPFKVFF